MVQPLVFIGIDPGVSGGLAVVSDSGSVGCSPMPATERDVWDWIMEAISSRRAFAVIERVGGFIQGNPTPGSAMFRFGMSYGGLRMALIGNNVPFDDATPQKWQKAMGVTPRRKDESKTAFKNRLKSRAQALFPKIKVTLAVSDALLIAEFCRRIREKSPSLV